MQAEERKKNDNPIILMDCHAVGHSSKHVYGVLNYDGRPTGVIYGFLTQILMLYKVFDTNEFIFAWDSGKHHRRRLLKDYKSRKDDWTEEEQEEYEIAKQQFHTLRRKVLPELGFKNIFIQTGHEADDIIASIVRNNSHNFIVASDDKDLYQLLDFCNLWKLRKKKVYTKEDLLKEWECTPDQWAKQKMYSGCKGDNVPNIPGVADKSAISFLNHKLKGKKLQSILETDKEFLERNRRLTNIPFEGTKKFKLKFNHRFNITDFIRVFDYYGFVSFMKGNRLKEWKEFCK